MEAENQAPATLRALFDAYVEDLAARGKGDDTIERAAQTARVIERLKPELLERSVSSIGDAEIFALRSCAARRPSRRSSCATWRRRFGPQVMRTLRAMLKRARPDYRFPAGGFFSEDETRVRWLRPEEQGVVLLPQAKAGARPVILSDAAQKILRAQLEASGTDEWVFPSPTGRPYERAYVGRVFRRAAGLRDFHFHDLRYHGATMALNKGYSAPIVMALGGWKTERMMRRYAAVTDTTLRAAAEAVSGAETATRSGNAAISARRCCASLRPYKAEVAGSSPAPPTTEIPTLSA